MSTAHPSRRGRARKVFHSPIFYTLTALLIAAGCATDERTASPPAQTVPNHPWPAAGPGGSIDHFASGESPLQHRLKQPISVEFDKTPLAEAIETVRNKTEANIIVKWDQLAEKGFTQPDLVTLKTQNVPAVTVLERIAENLIEEEDGEKPFSIGLKHDVVIIGSEAFVLTETRRVGLYPIQDLLREMTRPLPLQYRARLSEAGGVGEPIAGSGIFSADADSEKPQASVVGGLNALPGPDEAVDKMTLLIRQTVGVPTYWEINGGTTASLKYLDGHLYLHAPDQVHRELEAFLQRFREAVQATLASNLRDVQVVHLLRRADRARFNGNYEQALRLTNLAGNIDPNHPLARAMRDVLLQTRANLRGEGASETAATQAREQ